MASKKANKSKEDVTLKEEVDNRRKHVGEARNFRFNNPKDHPDKYRWVTLNDGDVVPEDILPILEREDRETEAKRRVKSLEEDLADDGKRNFSTDGSKSSPGRKAKSEKSSKK